ncbi:DUF4097 family beta strand repeat-containing protein [Streptomyces fradiae]|uniref:DUF4097 family beta strand repeat-containing protein n=1 Tax=Streptomyces fradiae TaxID=1906 RepID=UPI00215657BC|nr:hypothetical protein [Streptomyces fradiae]
MHAPDAVGRAASAGPAAPVRAEAPPGPAVRPSVRAVARRTEDLVNALTRDDPLPAPEGIAGLLREHGEVEPVVVTVEDVARMREAALALRAVFAAEGLDAAVAELNGLLAHGSGPLRLTAAHGSISVDRVEGPAEIATSSGSLRVGFVDGAAVLKNSHGTTTVGVATGELRVSGANGDISVDRAEDSVTATTAHGTLRVGEVARGAVRLETSHGAIEVGVRDGTAAWLDVSSGAGQVRNALTASGAPQETDETVKVQARTKYGNIDIRRARP